MAGQARPVPASFQQLALASWLRRCNHCCPPTVNAPVLICHEPPMHAQGKVIDAHHLVHGPPPVRTACAGELFPGTCLCTCARRALSPLLLPTRQGYTHSLFWELTHTGCPRAYNLAARENSTGHSALSCDGTHGMRLGFLGSRLHMCCTRVAAAPALLLSSSTSSS